jgi:hypothetical protein
LKYGKRKPCKGMGGKARRKPREGLMEGVESVEFYEGGLIISIRSNQAI